MNLLAFYLHGMLFFAGYFFRQLIQIKEDYGYQPLSTWAFDISMAIILTVFWPATLVYCIGQGLRK